MTTPPPRLAPTTDRFPLARLALLVALAVVLPACGGGPAAEGPAPAPQPTADAAQEQDAVWSWDTSDPRLGLRPGHHDAGQAAWGMELVANRPLPDGFGTNSDLAFGGNWTIVGNYNGFNIYDVTDPTNPDLRLSVLCPGNQGDVSIHGNLLFKSVQAASSPCRRPAAGWTAVPRASRAR